MTAPPPTNQLPSVKASQVRQSARANFWRTCLDQLLAYLHQLLSEVRAVIHLKGRLPFSLERLLNLTQGPPLVVERVTHMPMAMRASPPVATKVMLRAMFPALGPVKIVGSGRPPVFCRMR